MRTRTVLAAALAVLALVAAGCGSDDDGATTDTTGTTAPASTSDPTAGPTTAPTTSGATGTTGGAPAPVEMTLTSSAFADGASMPSDYACPAAGGRGQSPPLAWDGVPEGTSVLVLIVHDPDAPTEGGFTHLVTSFPPDSTGVDAGANADQTGPMVGWIPACPPSGEHRYQFGLYAFGDAQLAPGDPFSKDQVEGMADDALAVATLTGLYAAP